MSESRTPMNSPTAEELHAFIDGELDAARAVKVAAALQRDEALAVQMAAFNADKHLLREAYDRLIEEPLPAAWTDMIDQAQTEGLPAAQVLAFPRRFGTLSRAAMAFAASIVLLLAGIASYRAFAPQRGDIVAEALAVHRTAQTVTGADPARAESTLRETLGLALKTPDLSKMGYVLSGMEVRGEAVELGYRNAENRRVTLLLKRSPGTPRFDIIKEGAAYICVWQDDVLSSVMVGEMSAAEMLRLAALAYGGLS